MYKLQGMLYEFRRFIIGNKLDTYRAVPMALVFECDTDRDRFDFINAVLASVEALDGMYDVEQLTAFGRTGIATFMGVRVEVRSKEQLQREAYSRRERPTR